MQVNTKCNDTPMATQSNNKGCCCALCVQVSNMENSNTRAELERIKAKVLQHLQTLPPVPSVAVAVMPPATKVGHSRQQQQQHGSNPAAAGRQASANVHCHTCTSAGVRPSVSA